MYLLFLCHHMSRTIVRIKQIVELKTGRRVGRSVVTIQKVLCLKNTLSWSALPQLSPTCKFTVTFLEKSDR